MLRAGWHTGPLSPAQRSRVGRRQQEAGGQRVGREAWRGAGLPVCAGLPLARHSLRHHLHHHCYSVVAFPISPRTSCELSRRVGTVLGACAACCCCSAAAAAACTCRCAAAGARAARPVRPAAAAAGARPLLLAAEQENCRLLPVTHATAAAAIAMSPGNVHCRWRLWVAARGNAQRDEVPPKGVGSARPVLSAGELWKKNCIWSEPCSGRSCAAPPATF